jgi:hypothetical protein
MGFRPDKDDAGRQLDPAEIPACAAIQPPGDATELGQERMPTLDGAADATNPRLPGATPFGRLHPKAGGVGAGLAGAVAVGAIGTGAREIPRVGVGYRGLGGRRLHDHRLQYRLGLHAVVGRGLGHDRPQGQAVLVGR